ncbi:MAG: hypothetical protein ACRDPY_16255 [Streptosporangiaceae bacterium]
MTTTPTPQNDLDLIDSLAASDRAAQITRFRDWFGWRPSTAHPCPRTAAGKRCRAYHDAEPCICQRLHHRLLDHPRMWLTAKGERVFTAEPYQFDGNAFADLVHDCDQLGLDITVQGTSPYFPGRTALIIIRKARS